MANRDRLDPLAEATEGAGAAIGLEAPTLVAAFSSEVFTSSNCLEVPGRPTLFQHSC